MKIHELLRKYDDRHATSLLILLICGDLFFMALHVVNAYTLDTSLFDITADRKLPEIYQYLKFMAICFLLKHAADKHHCRQYYAWIVFFVYLLLDDSLKIHEKCGKLIANHIAFVPPFGLSMHNFAELAVSVIAASLLIFPLLWAYGTGSRTFRAISHRLALLIGVLVCFGVLVDVAGGMLFTSAGGLVMELLEDGGEMVSVSAITWYAFRTASSNRNTVPGLLG